MYAPWAFSESSLEFYKPGSEICAGATALR